MESSLGYKWRFGPLSCCTATQNYQWIHWYRWWC